MSAAFDNAKWTDLVAELHNAASAERIAFRAFNSAEREWHQAKDRTETGRKALDDYFDAIKRDAIAAATGDA